MKIILCILLLLANVPSAQKDDKFLTNFLLSSELKEENTLSKYNKFNFSNIWNKTENHMIFGIIGQSHKRIRIKLISIRQNDGNKNNYIVSGKSNTDDVICNFIGIIELVEIKEVKKLHFGVDDEYKNKHIKAQGILVANYLFKENGNDKYSGKFQGKLYSKWYLSFDNNIKYDDIESASDGYMNNAFIGTWSSYSTGKQKTCNWADFRVPQANEDFDIGAGEFSPSEKYYQQGWENYQKAWLYGNKEAQSKETQNWWQ